MTSEQVRPATLVVATEIRTLVNTGRLELEPVGEGRTALRWRALYDLARRNVALGRLAEAHVDGHQILREAGCRHETNRLLGVWASDHPRHMLSADIVGNRVVLAGSKSFCTGAGLVDDALVTASTPAGPQLVLVPLDQLDPGRIDLSEWRATALADTRTAVVDFEGVETSAAHVVGGPGWYLERPGFWHGAIGPAACWAGAAAGLVDHVLAHAPSDPHGRAHLGGLVSAQWSMEAAFDAAGREIDALPTDLVAAHRRALVVRHLVDDRCRDAQDRFGRALGPRPFVNDATIAERNEALTIYRRQCHGERDLEALGALVSRAPTESGR